MVSLLCLVGYHSPRIQVHHSVCAGDSDARVGDGTTASGSREPKNNEPQQIVRWSVSKIIHQAVCRVVAVAVTHEHTHTPRAHTQSGTVKSGIHISVEIDLSDRTVQEHLNVGVNCVVAIPIKRYVVSLQG